MRDLSPESIVACWLQILNRDTIVLVVLPIGLLARAARSQYATFISNTQCIFCGDWSWNPPCCIWHSFAPTDQSRRAFASHVYYVPSEPFSHQVSPRARCRELRLSRQTNFRANRHRGLLIPYNISTIHFGFDFPASSLDTGNFDPPLYASFCTMTTCSACMCIYNCFLFVFISPLHVIENLCG